MSERYQKNKQKTKEYYLKNREKILEWNKTDGKKSIKISSWKKRGVISDNYSSLYDYYLNCNNCELCNVELIEGNYGNNKKTLDHDHETGLFRYVLCNTCNSHRTANRHTPRTKEQIKTQRKNYRDTHKDKEREYGANRRFRDKLRDFIYS